MGEWIQRTFQRHASQRNPKRQLVPNHLPSPSHNQSLDQRIQPYPTPSKPRYAPTNTRNYDLKIGTDKGGLTEEVTHIRPNGIRRLKTSNSTRTLPLVGYAKEAMKLALQQADDHCLYPRYLKDGTCRATHASNALGKWLKRDFGLTAHSLRHTFRDRLRASGCPLELIDQIGGWSSIGTIGSKYGQGYDLNAFRKQIRSFSL